MTCNRDTTLSGYDPEDHLDEKQDALQLSYLHHELEDLRNGKLDDFMGVVERNQREQTLVDAIKNMEDGIERRRDLRKQDHIALGTLIRTLDGRVKALEEEDVRKVLSDAITESIVLEENLLHRIWTLKNARVRQLTRITKLSADLRKIKSATWYKLGRMLRLVP